MRLTIALESRFSRTPDGSVWTDIGMHHGFWKRYLEEFESVTIAARVRECDAVKGQWRRVDGPGVSVAPLAHYIGPVEFLRRSRRLRKQAAAALRSADALILRGPGQIASLFIEQIGRSRRPFGLEVVGDAYDVFAPGGVQHPLRPMFRWWFTRRQRFAVKRAAAVLYVTANTLQKRYPPSGFHTHASNVEISAADLAAQPWRAETGSQDLFRLVFVGSLEQLYKGPDILIRALADVTRAGIPARLSMIGGGRHLPDMQRLAEQLGVKERIQFLGSLPSGEPVREHLSAADLFVLPSRTEGMPRAMIEAMACGLGCVGSAVGGIPELLPQECLVPPGDVRALAGKITEMWEQPGALERHAAANLVAAHQYIDSVLQRRRVQFYREVALRTREWRLGRTEI